MPCRSLRATACRLLRMKHAAHCATCRCAHGMALARLNSDAREAEILRLLPALHVHLRSPQRSKAKLSRDPSRFRPSSSDRCRREGDGRACACVRACVRLRACACVRYVSVQVHAGACNQARAFTNMRALARAWRDLLHGVIEHRRVKRVHKRVAGVTRRPRVLRQSRTGRRFGLGRCAWSVRRYDRTRATPGVCARRCGVRGGCGGRQWRSTSGGIVGQGRSASSPIPTAFIVSSSSLRTQPSESAPDGSAHESRPAESKITSVAAIADGAGPGVPCERGLR